MKIINIGILAHVDAGKTTLTESLLYTSGAITELGSVENTLPMLMECQDNLEYLKDDNAYVLRQKVAHIEDDLLPPLLAYIRDHDKKKE